MDLLIFDDTLDDFVSKGYSKDYIHSNSTVFPKQLITFNPMQYVIMKKKTENVYLFAEDIIDNGRAKPLTYELYQKLLAQLGKRNKDAILPIQIAYFTGLRLKEVAGLTWQDINLEEQF